MKRLAAGLSLTLMLLLLLSATPVLAGGGGGGIYNPPGNPVYVIIEVNWDGSDDYGD